MAGQRLELADPLVIVVVGLLAGTTAAQPSRSSSAGMITCTNKRSAASPMPGMQGGAKGWAS